MKYLKFMLTLFLPVLMIGLNCIPVSAETGEEEAIVLLYGEQYHLSANPFFKDNHYYIPILEVIEAMGGEADWEESAERATLKLWDQYYTIWGEQAFAHLWNDQEKCYQLFRYDLPDNSVYKEQTLFITTESASLLTRDLISYNPVSKTLNLGLYTVQESSNQVLKGHPLESSYTCYFNPKGENSFFFQKNEGFETGYFTLAENGQLLNIEISELYSLFSKDYQTAMDQSHNELKSENRKKVKDYGIYYDLWKKGQKPEENLFSYLNQYYEQEKKRSGIMIKKIPYQQGEENTENEDSDHILHAIEGFWRQTSDEWHQLQREESFCEEWITEEELYRIANMQFTSLEDDKLLFYLYKNGKEVYQIPFSSEEFYKAETKTVDISGIRMRRNGNEAVFYTRDLIDAGILEENEVEIRLPWKKFWIWSLESYLRAYNERYEGPVYSSPAPDIW